MFEDETGVAAAPPPYSVWIDIEQPASLAAAETLMDESAFPVASQRDVTVAEARAGYPFSAVVHITTWWPKAASPGGKNEPDYGSGVMVGRNDVLTAAHVIYDADRGGYPTHVLIEPMWWPDTGERPYGAAYGTPWVSALYPSQGLDVPGQAGVRLPDENAGYWGSEIDIGFVHLAAPLGDKTGWMVPWPDFTDRDMNQTGYPHYPNSHYVRGFTNDVAWARNDPHGTYRDAVIDISAFETYGGNSGGPIWTMGGDGRAYVAGVVSTGAYNKATGVGAGHYATDIDAMWHQTLTTLIASNDHLIVA